MYCENPYTGFSYVATLIIRVVAWAYGVFTGSPLPCVRP